MAEQNQTKANYPRGSLALVKAGLLFVAVKLGDLLDEIVVVGGVVPSLLIDQERATQAHVGTTDLDLALSLNILDDKRYSDLAARLRSAGFTPTTKANGNVVRQTWQLTGSLGGITVDFLIPRSAEADPLRRLQDLEKDFAAIRTRGLELAFLDRHDIVLDDLTIMGDRARRTVQVAGLAAMLVLKAFAFRSRGAEKDAYDAFYLIHEHGPESVVAAISPFLDHPTLGVDVRDALTIYAEDFVEQDGVGVGSVTRFSGDSDNDELRADVVGAFRAVLRRVGHAHL